MSADLNWNIGKDNDLLFKVKEDLKHFQRETKNNTVIMGRKTYESLGVECLPDRLNVVFTSNLKHPKNENLLYFHSLEELLFFVRKMEAIGKEIYVIGGATMIEILLPFIDLAIITRFQEIRPGDTSMVRLDTLPEWKLESCGDFVFSKDQHGETVVFRIETYKRA